VLTNVGHLNVIHLSVVVLVEVNGLLGASQHLSENHLVYEGIRAQLFGRVQDFLDVCWVEQDQYPLPCCVDEKRGAVAILPPGEILLAGGYVIACSRIQQNGGDEMIHQFRLS
jgi:hypothetical protein